ncbi:PREDICTED: uncharacterized protein LOC101293076 [Fragaria vesca subsp. vesca]|uniref:uncharacterized protein LOC101293076 n=1 Tax=Fragaria vesca subsp. vesca TaxID=101020 RepID=UPI0002C2E46A|nr:PREDICTED: uncharacterized protein LOC101293076 [Fragaria vesca subsp. vesca]
MARIPASTARELLAASFSGMVFGFLEDGGQEFEQSCSSSDGSSQETEAMFDMEDDQEDAGEDEKDKKFWENQNQILQATLCRTSSLETKIRSVTKVAVKESGEAVCGCGKESSGCRSCLMREVSGRLCNAGYNSAICKSQWRSSPDIPSGEHTFLDVVDNSSSRKGEVRVIIELNFRAEFEMARANDEYNRLVKRLPEIFVGKVERLQNLIKILCSAAKKCMKEKKMHMGPWRKQKYMQAKWLGACKRTIATSTPPLSVGQSERLRLRPKASMLTVDLLGEMMPNMHCAAVAVV